VVGAGAFSSPAPRIHSTKPRGIHRLNHRLDNLMNHPNADAVNLPLL
jgi:hypothetical protein